MENGGLHVRVCLWTTGQEEQGGEDSTDMRAGPIKGRAEDAVQGTH